MDKSPSVNDKQRLMMKKQCEPMLKEKNEEMEKLEKFRKEVEKAIEDFIEDDSKRIHEFNPMDRVFRSRVLDVVQMAGVSAYMVGDEGVDRRVVAYKQEFASSEDELAELWRIEKWTPEKAKEIADQRECEEDFVYEEEYWNLIDEDVTVTADEKTETNRAYGFVPSENKRDARSIEQTLPDLQRQKRQKVDAGAPQESPPPGPPEASEDPHN